MSDDRFADVAEDGGIGGYEPEFVDVNGLRTRYYDVGSGEPLVLAHGGIWGGVQSANSWWPSFEHLSEEFRVIAFDRVGCGLTDSPDDPEEYHWGTEFDHAFGFLDALGLDSCHIGGFSRGGGLAIRMAVEDRDRFETLVVLNSNTFGPKAGDRSYRGERIFERFTPDYEPTDPAYSRLRYEQYSYRTDNITDRFCRTNAWMRSQPAASRAGEIMADRKEGYEQSKREAMWEAQDRIKRGELTLPTLYVFGRNDLTTRLQQGLAAFDMIAQHNPDVRLRLVNHCAHMICMEIPEEFAASVISFADTMS